MAVECILPPVSFFPSGYFPDIVKERSKLDFHRISMLSRAIKSEKKVLVECFPVHAALLKADSS